MKPTDILKRRYTIRPFDVEVMCSHSRRVYELFPDGKIRYSIFEKGNSKPIKKQENHTASLEDYIDLCTKINDCIDAADTVNQYVDDCSVDVKLYRSFGRVDTMDRGYGNSNTDLGEIITRYIYGVGGMQW